MSECLNDTHAVQELFRSVLNKLFSPVPLDSDVLQHQRHWFLPAAAEQWSLESLSRSASQLNLLSDSDEEDTADLAAAAPPPGIPPDETESNEQAVCVLYLPRSFCFVDCVASGL